jgi:hypothetical protein
MIQDILFRNPFNGRVNLFNSPGGGAGVLNSNMFSGTQKRVTSKRGYAEFHNNLTHTAILERGVGDPTFDRESPATFLDFESLVKNVGTDEIRFGGARRVYNFTHDSGSSEDLTSTGWNDHNGGNRIDATTFRLVGGTADISHTVLSGGETFVTGDIITISWTLSSIDGDGKTIKMQINGDAIASSNKEITLTSTPTRYSFTSTAFTGIPTWALIYIVKGSTGTPIGDTDDIIFENVQIEKVTGQANQNPSEYVSKGVLSSPWNGAGKDGVAYYPYENGNTVDGSGVVTEATGIALTTLMGYQTEPERLNYCQGSSDLTDATYWTGTRLTTPSTTIAPNGLDEAALLAMDATADTNHRLTQTGLAFAFVDNTTYVSSTYFKKKEYDWIRVTILKKDGTQAGGYFDLTNGVVGSKDATATTGIKDIGNGWYRCWVAVDVLVGATVPQIRMFIAEGDGDQTIAGVQTGKGLYAWGSQLEAGLRPTSYIINVNTDNGVTRKEDMLQYDIANFNDPEGAVVAEFYPAEIDASLSRSFIVSFESYTGIYLNGPAGDLFTIEGDWDSLNGDAVTEETWNKGLGWWSFADSNKMNTVLNGVAYAGADERYDNMSAGTHLGIGNREDALTGSHFNGFIREVKIFKTRPDVTTRLNLTT